MQEKIVMPYAPILAESTRSIGYSFEAAVADIIDNSISASATEVRICFSSRDPQWLCIEDNGWGMTPVELENAMRYGSQSSTDVRRKDDLGRFGLGLKMASLSQCRKVTVMTKKDDVTCAACWDLDYIIQQKNWSLQFYSEEELEDMPGYLYLKLKDSGTVVTWERFDRLKQGAAQITKAVRFVGKRYKEWREMLANARGNLLSPEEIKGLLGEMYYLKNYLAPLYGIEKAALSWTGPRRLPQDFILDDTWHEVKTISSGKSEVSISSIEQLDSVRTGELVILRADKTSIANTNAVNLNSLYKDLMTLIASDHEKEIFSNMLLRYGYYPRAEYESEEYTFEIKGMQRYVVNTDFPCIRRADLPASVTEAKYALSVAAIEPYTKE